MDALLGQKVGSYTVTGKIAEGGMGAVYRAEHTLLGKAAAVKVLLPELSANADIVNRFFNEARAATAIRHPGIVEIFDFGYLASGTAFLVMELLDGEPLSRRLAMRERLDERTACRLVRSIAGTLGAAHGRGIVHRDLKPDNVFLVSEPDVPGGERPKLLDFGIAKLTEAQHGGGVSRTRTGTLMGTPTYMSPEQCRGAGEIDQRSDLYALGCVFYEMLTGRPPFTGEGLGQIIAAHLFQEPEPPARLVPELSATIEALVLRLLAKHPDDRVQSATELARLLGQGSAPELNVGSSVGYALPTSPAVPTTLGGAAGSTDEAGIAPRGTSSRVLALIAFVAAASAGVFALTRGDDSEPATAAAIEIDARVEPVVPASEVDAGLDAGLDATPDAAPDAPPAAATDLPRVPERRPAKRRERAHVHQPAIGDSSGSGRIDRGD